MIKPHILPDLLTPDLAVVFCGTAAGTVPAKRGHYYAHPQNKFWKTLHAIRLTPRQLAPHEFRELLGWRIGLTDIAKHVYGMDKELPTNSLGHDACVDLRVRIETCRPAILAFTSLTAGKNFLKRTVSPGRQSETIGATKVWVLPSPSPIAQWNWDETHWRQLRAEIK